MDSHVVPTRTRGITRASALGMFAFLLAAPGAARNLVIPSVAAGAEPFSTAEAQEEQARFEAFCIKILNETIAGDTLILREYFRHPEDYGIHAREPRLNHMLMPNEQLERAAEYEEWHKELMAIDRELLTADQQWVYDIADVVLVDWSDERLYGLYESKLASGSADYLIYVLCFVQYAFTCEDDIEVYGALLQDLQSCFESLVAYGRLQAEAGLAPLDDQLELGAQQCLLLAEATEDNPFIDSFNRRIDAASFLDDDARAFYKAQNARLFDEAVAPAYIFLADALTSLKGVGAREGGLATVEGGREYYERLVRTTTGSSHSIDELREMCEDCLVAAIDEYLGLWDSHPELYDEVYVQGHYDLADIYQFIKDMEQASRADFPYLSDRVFTVETVAPSLAGYIYEGIYMFRPLDDATTNGIYLNEGALPTDYVSLAVYAHEGIPGHLYQINYFYEKGAYPAYQVGLMPLGYLEGWAMYACVEALNYMNDDPVVNRLRTLEFCLAYNIASLIDMAINYYGMSLDEVQGYIGDLAQGFATYEMVESACASATNTPAFYHSYWIGYLEFKGLRTDAETALGDAFDPVAFHDFVLTLGPAPFDLIHDRLDQWIADQLAVQGETEAA